MQRPLVRLFTPGSKWCFVIAWIQQAFLLSYWLISFRFLSVGFVCPPSLTYLMIPMERCFAQQSSGIVPFEFLAQRHFLGP